MTSQTRKNAFRGAKIGAVCMGGASFSTAMLICLLHRVPIPPLAITEFGIILGGLSGAGIGILCSTQTGRYSLVGILAGLLLGTLLGWVTMGSHGAIWTLRIALLGGVIGWRLALNHARKCALVPAWTPY